MNLEQLKEYLPLLIPLIVVQLVLLAYALWHINTHQNYKRGTRLIWNIIALAGMNFVGPILYLVLGKEEE